MVQQMIKKYADLGNDIESTNWLELAKSIGTNKYKLVKRELEKYCEQKEEIIMVGIRKPSASKSFKARTTGRVNRTVKRAANPLYGKKGAGFVKDPERSIKNTQ